MVDQAEDPLAGLEERYLRNERALESLLALTPAREYYGSQIDDGLDPSGQWNRKKQTKEQRRAARKAKLDPANQKTALDVVREREQNRKRKLGSGDDNVGGNSGDACETATEPNSKRQKQEVTGAESDAKTQAKVDKRRQKREMKKQKIATKRARTEAKKATQQDTLPKEQDDTEERTSDLGVQEDDDLEACHVRAGPEEPCVKMDKLDLLQFKITEGEEVTNDLLDEANTTAASSAPTSPALDSPAFDVSTNHSEASSSSSVVPPSVSGQLKTQSTPSKPNFQIDLSDQKPLSIQQKALSSYTDLPSGTSSPKLQLPDIDQEQLQERLRKRIEALRAQRKADGADGKPAKSRQELLEQRRRKEEQRKVSKKEQRRQAREEEARKRDQQLQGSGSPLSVEIFSRNSPRPQDNNFSFGRLAFDDGSAADASVTELRGPVKRKGPQDAKTALQAAEKKQLRLAGLDAAKRADIAEKDMWLNAKKRAHGERVRDDTNLLKQALKRKEKQKGKSEKEWKEREEAVVKGKEAKQKKREANLQKRREEKGQKGKAKHGGGQGKKRARPGFEGRFKA